MGQDLLREVGEERPPPAPAALALGGGGGVGEALEEVVVQPVQLGHRGVGRVGPGGQGR